MGNYPFFFLGIHFLRILSLTSFLNCSTLEAGTLVTTGTVSSPYSCFRPAPSLAPPEVISFFIQKKIIYPNVKNIYGKVLLIQKDCLI